ncbi:hypothetical protein GQX74_015777 [Glossina fuscipes]|nr:hypothetical protein GQX74_015777 [Glossina fuscipes]
MIVDLLRNDIANHMISTITGKLNHQYSPFDLLQACFPGGSITGAPKISAMNIIEQLEPNKRNAWCGSIGYISFCKSMNTSIVIRTLIASNKQLFCSVGSGIIHDSNIEDEYQELILKASSILPPLLDFLKKY